MLEQEQSVVYNYTISTELIKINIKLKARHIFDFLNKKFLLPAVRPLFEIKNPGPAARIFYKDI